MAFPVSAIINLLRIMIFSENSLGVSDDSESAFRENPEQITPRS